MKLKSAVIFAVLVSVIPLAAQTEHLYVLDQPAPVSLKHGEYFVSARLQLGDGVLARAAVGLFDRLTLGLSYAADTVLGHGMPRFTQPVGFQARVLALQEGTWYPAVLTGYESQGYDGYQSSRYRTLPQGIYLVLGKTIWSTRTEVTAGANYLPGNGFDGHLAVREFALPDFDFMLEYDLATNDGVMRPRLFSGLLNFGIGATINGNLNLRLGLRDILGSRRDDVAGFQIGLNRTFDISFQQHF